MFNQLDIAIALVVVLLGVSILVTIAVQAVSAGLNLRGAHLRGALATLLRTVDVSLDAHADAIVDAVLTHPLVSDSAFSHGSPFVGAGLVPARVRRAWQRASAVRLSELKAVLHQLAKDDGAGTAPWRAALGTALAEDSRQLLASAQVTLDELKKALPEAERERLESIAHEVVSRFGGMDAKLDAWFDTAMGRASQRFTLNIRAWTVAAAVTAAVVMHLDVLDMYNKMAADPAVRSRLVALALPLEARAAEGGHASDDLDGLEASADATLKTFAVAQYQLTIPSLAEQRRRFRVRGWEALLGIAIGAALLSLGSPFWFSALKNLTSLRSTVAAAIDQEPSGAPPARAPAPQAARV